MIKKIFTLGYAANVYMHNGTELLKLDSLETLKKLASGRSKYIAEGGKVGRKLGYRKPMEVKEEEYKEVIRHLRKGTTIRDTAKLTGHCIRTVQQIKKEFDIKKPKKAN